MHVEIMKCCTKKQKEKLKRKNNSDFKLDRAFPIEISPMNFNNSEFCRMSFLDRDCRKDSKPMKG